MTVEEVISLSEEDLDDLLQIDDETALVDWFNEVTKAEWDEPSALEVVGFLVEDRYTLDEESCQVSAVDTASFPALSGSIQVEYTASCRWGCKDMDDLADARHAMLGFRVDRELMQLIITVEAPERLYPCDEL